MQPQKQQEIIKPTETPSTVAENYQKQNVSFFQEKLELIREQKKNIILKLKFY